MTEQTRAGAFMNTTIKNKLIEVLSNPIHEGKTQREIARILKITTRTVQNYLTFEVWQEINERRLQVISNSLNLVDKAVFAKAIDGDMTAAKILYKRWDEAKQQEDFNLEDISENDDIDEIKRLEKNIQELENDKGNRT